MALLKIPLVCSPHTAHAAPPAGNTGGVVVGPTGGVMGSWLVPPDKAGAEEAAAEEDAPGATSKAADVAHLACGLVLQAAGLLAGVGIAAGSGEAAWLECWLGGPLCTLPGP